MTQNYLLPYGYKKVGMWMFIPFCAVCLWCLKNGEFNYLECPCISLFSQRFSDDCVNFCTIGTTDPINEIGMLGLLVSLCFIALSKEKDEDEMTAIIRMQSFVWSLWITAALILFGILFIYEMSFLTFTFAALYFAFIIYVLKFNFTMRKIRRTVK